MKYNLNPFPKLFHRGLNVTLSSDDPLILHLSEEPLLEEYAIATQVFIILIIILRFGILVMLTNVNSQEIQLFRVP